MVHHTITYPEFQWHANFENVTKWNLVEIILHFIFEYFYCLCQFSTYHVDGLQLFYQLRNKIL